MCVYIVKQHLVSELLIFGGITDGFQEGGGSFINSVAAELIEWQ